ncbi:hypothetical protein Droror1_Dr00028227 [Drosera rotundifolia]
MIQPPPPPPSPTVVASSIRQSDAQSRQVPFSHRQKWRRRAHSSHRKGQSHRAHFSLRAEEKLRIELWAVTPSGEKPCQGELSSRWVLPRGEAISLRSAWMLSYDHASPWGVFDLLFYCDWVPWFEVALRVSFGVEDFGDLRSMVMALTNGCCWFGELESDGVGFLDVVAVLI